MGEKRYVDEHFHDICSLIMYIQDGSVTSSASTRQQGGYEFDYQSKLSHSQKR